MASRLRVRKAAENANTYLAINRMAAQGGLRAIGYRARQKPRLSAWSLPYASIVEMMVMGTPRGEFLSADDIRRPLDRVTLIAQPGKVTRRRMTTSLFSGEWVTTPASHPKRVILFLHGGGYVSGSPSTHMSVIMRLARAARARVFALDYRLAPEHPFPAALEDAWAAYWWLITEARVEPQHLVIAGDSAGGGLTIALLLALRDAGMPLPAGAAGLSPWLDLTLSGGSMAVNERTDYLNADVLRASARMYCSGHDPRDPLISPLFADMRGLPPLLIQAGSAEMLLDDSRRFAERARAAGVDVQLELWEHMVHVWHFTCLVEPKARGAVESIGRFVRRRVPLALIRATYAAQEPL